MARVVDAIYEAGMLKPLEALDLPEHQRVRITIHDAAEESPEETLEAWQGVFDGLTDEEIVQVEAVAYDRRHFMRQAP